MERREGERSQGAEGELPSQGGEHEASPAAPDQGVTTDPAAGDRPRLMSERQGTDEPGPAPEPQPAAEDERGAESAARSEPLLAGQDTDEFLRRWEAIQIGFVDEPQRSVQQADTLVSEVIQRIADTFSEERSRLEGHWSRGQDVATDDLRVALQRYRSFFRRLLST